MRRRVDKDITGFMFLQYVTVSRFAFLLIMSKQKTFLLDCVKTILGNSRYAARNLG